MASGQQLEQACAALYTAESQQMRLAAEAYLCSVFPAPGAPAPGAPPAAAAASAHLCAAHPAYLPALQGILSGSASPYAWLFSLGSIVMCVDSSWLRVPQEAQWELRTFLLQWLADKGPQCEAAGAVGQGARDSAITALCRITKLCWREDARHHATAAHALQFLAPASRAHWGLGLQLWARLVDDMQRPHPHLRDRPTVRLLMFRDLALRPLATRLAGLLQELLPLAHATAAALAGAPGGGGGGGAPGGAAPAPPQPPPIASANGEISCFVGGIPPNITETELLAHFRARFGTLTGARIARDTATGASKG